MFPFTPYRLFPNRSMSFFHTPLPLAPSLTLNRRAFLGGFCACGAALALSGCASGKGAGGGGSLFAMSPQDELRLGTQAWQRVSAEAKKSNDAGLNRAVGDVSGRIIKAAGRDAAGLPWEYAVFENPEANAFALPGGKIGVNTGLFKVAENEHQLATVLGHEIRHVTGHHGARRYEQQAMTSTGLKLASVALGAGGVQNADQIVSILGAGANVGIILPFSREQETEADMVGLDYMAAAGFDPRQSVKFWENMMNKAGAGKGPSFLSTHPSGADRIANLTARTNAILARQRG